MTPCASAVSAAGMSRPCRRETDGAVTVLMAITTILIFSLILVSLESARQQGAVAMFHMNLQTASESVLGEYYAPLFDDYGLYGLYDVDIEEEIRSYLSVSGRPEQSVSGSSAGEDKSYYSYAYDISEVALSKTVTLLHGGGAICKNQMIEEGAISGIQELAELLLNAVKLLKETEQTAEALETQQKVQQELAVFEEKMLALAQQIDGIKTDASGVVFRDDGTPETITSFVKRAIPGEVSQASVHMSNTVFYEQLKPQYDNIKLLTDELFYGVTALPDEGDAEVDENTLRAYVFLLTAVHDSFLGARGAIPILEDLIELQDKFRPMVTEFEQYMESCQSLIDEDMYKSLEETLRILKSYVGAKDGGKTYDFAKMKKTLERNIEVLLPVYELMRDFPQTTQEWKKLNKVYVMLMDYSIAGLELDYSEVKKSTAGDSSFWQTLKNLLTRGIVGGVYPADEELSSATLYLERDLPSKSVEEDIRTLYVYPDISEDGPLSVALLKALLKGNFLKTMLNRLADGVVEISEKLLLIAYFSTHMSNYLDQDPEGVMHYEQEYLLYGKTGDAQNQRSATLSILGIRVLMNIIHVFSDSVKKTEALAVAAEFLSAMPFPLLVKVVQTIILVIWAIQNAYLETAEILQGKQVPLLVTTGSFQLSLSNSLLMSRDKRIEIAKEYKPPEGLKLGYDHYLMLFMLLRNSDTMTGRALDLIQVNIRSKYDEDFLIKKCVYGFEVSATAEVSPLYTIVSFGDTDEEGISAYSIPGKCAVSY